MCEYVSSFGGVVNEAIVINCLRKDFFVRFEDVVKIVSVKRRKLHINMLFFIMAIFFFLLVSLGNDLFVFEVLLGFVSISFLVFSFFYTSIEYKLVLVKKFDFIEFIVNKKLQMDAEILVSEFNKKMNKSVE